MLSIGKRSNFFQVRTHLGLRGHPVRDRRQLQRRAQGPVQAGERLSILKEREREKMSPFAPVKAGEQLCSLNETDDESNRI